MIPHSERVETQINGKKLVISTGSLARHAGGAVVVEYGDTVVLGCATMGRPLRPDAHFMPLLVEYEEKYYAAGKIKGSRFIKREGRPSDEAIVTSRLIDRSIRPLFPDEMINDVQVVATVLSYDGECDPQIPAIIAACAALTLSDVPWSGPLAAVRMGYVDEQLIANPSPQQLEKSKLDAVIVGTGDRVVMIEANGHEVPEELLVKAIDEAKKLLGEISQLLSELREKSGKEKQEHTRAAIDLDKIKLLQEKARPTLTQKLDSAKTKREIGQAERDTVAFIKEGLSDDEQLTYTDDEIRLAVHELHGTYSRERILKDSYRTDGRKLDEIRPLFIQAGVLPRTHGSGIFQRGETQILTTLTLGGPSDTQIIDTMQTDTKKRYIHFYNFPAYSVGEIRPNRGPGRREIGHGALAERALVPVLPDKEKWPYTMLLVSEVLESHGSSSMASACGSSLALMDAGVPITRPVAGIAMGLISDDKGNYKILTDIAGIEDEKGDMDFKVAGTSEGVTALQMDIKIAGVTTEMLRDALAQAEKARHYILGEMAKVIASPRPELSPYAPRIHTMRIPVDKIGDLIGPKGKHITEIIDSTGVEIDVEDDGLVSITSNDAAAMEKAKEWIHNLTREIKAGERFEGKVTRILDFGAFVELTPNVEGMVHISQFREERIDSIGEVVKVGDIIPVIVTEIDDMGRINLSHKAALPGAKPYNPADNKPSNGRTSHNRRSSSSPHRRPHAPRR